MKTLLILFAAAMAASAPAAAAEPPPAETQIAGAVLAAPQEWRDQATVLGYNAEGTLVPLRKGDNQMICLADDPTKEKFNVACYHKDLEPYMARGRELTAEGIKGKQRYDIRWKEIEEGKLAVTREPRTLYVLTGSDYDTATGEVADSYLRWVIYTPYATNESTGLSSSPAPGAPWLMFPGTPGAHVMISPPKPKQ